MNRPRPLRQLLGKDTSASLIARMHYLQSLNGLLRGCLDTETAIHVQIADFRAEQLLIHADSTAWATRLRYQVPQLLRCLHQAPQLAGARRIVIRVAPPAQPVSPTKRPVLLSAASAAVIDSNADSLTDPALRAALKRLARRGRT